MNLLQFLPRRLLEVTASARALTERTPRLLPFRLLRSGVMRALRPASLLLAAVALLALVGGLSLLLPLASPAQAQATCTLNTGDLWCGVVTVAELDEGTGSIGHGFLDDEPDQGALSDTTFSVGTNDYTIDLINVDKSKNGGFLQFSLTSALTTADKATLVLHIDSSSDTLAFSDAVGPNFLFHYEWEDTGLNWSSTSEVTLRLREGTGTPTPPTDEAPTATLVSNTGQGDSTGSADTVGAQPFTTGSAAVLTSVGVYLGSNSGLDVGDIRVRILQDNSGSPGTELVTLSNPTTRIDDTVNTFTAPADTNLAAATTYYVEMSKNGNSGVAYQRTRSHLEDAGGATNWEIGNTRYYKTNSGDAWSTATTVMLIDIKGPTRSDDATLTDLVVNDGTSDLTLTPTFASGKETYTASVVKAVAEVTLTPSLGDSGATIEYLDGSDATLDDADTAKDDFQVAVAEGDTVIKVKVTAADGVTTKTYTVTVNRAACTLNTGDLWCGVVSVTAATSSYLAAVLYGFDSK